jgi:hypothetical protein
MGQNVVKLLNFIAVVTAGNVAFGAWNGGFCPEFAAMRQNCGKSAQIC